MTTDVVGIFDNESRQLLPEGRPLKAEVRPTWKVMDHPVEKGSSVSDHKIRMPVEIDLTLVMQAPGARDTYKRLREISEQDETVTIQTRADSYADMTVTAMPHDETSDVFDALPVVVKFREVQFVETQFQALPPKAVGTGAGKRNASTVKRGEQSGKPEGSNAAGGRKSSVAYGLFYGKGGG